MNKFYNTEKITWQDRISGYLLPTSSLILVLLLIPILGVSCATKHGASFANSKIIQLVQSVLADSSNKENNMLLQYLEPVHFATGKDNPLNQEIEKLDSNINWLVEHPETIVLLEGHCDVRGNDIFNLKLGDRRARNVKKYMLDKGLPEERFSMVISMGEKEPKENKNTADAWRKNRRVEFIVR